MFVVIEPLAPLPCAISLRTDLNDNAFQNSVVLKLQRFVQRCDCIDGQ